MSADEADFHVRKPVVLIVEDEEPIALALSFIVEDAGYLPVIASRGQAALELVRARHPALIITDLMMPQMSGRDFIAALRQDASETRRTPIVLMTAAGRTYLTDIDADAVLLKPFDISVVDSLLQRFLG